MEWDVVIAPSSPWWRLHLGEIWRYRDLLTVLVQRDLTATYRQTILGPIWVLVQPLLTSLMFAVVFGLMARMSLPGRAAGHWDWRFRAEAVTPELVARLANMTELYARSSGGK